MLNHANKENIMSISAQDVKKLREMTGAGMMDCKKALTEANGDFSKAERILKELGLAAAAKRSDRETNEGRVFTKIAGDKAVILELACETDFVARNKDFEALGNDLVSYILENNVREMNDEITGKTAAAVATIKENINVSRFELIDLGENQYAIDYIHGDGILGVLVKFQADSAATISAEAVKEFSFDIALHIAAFAPLYLDKDAIEPAYIKEQEEIFTKQAENMDKPANVIQGIVKGKLNKHLSEICLLNQGFVKEDKVPVEKKMAEVAKSVNGSLNIEKFWYYRIG
jgi:elongation factor Ts